MKKITEIEWITEDHIDIMMSWYNSKDLFWPEMWSVLEKIIINYDNNCIQQRKSLLIFLDVLWDLIPCDECAEHFKKQISYNPPPDTRIELLQWIIGLHDNINELNGKNRLWFRDWLKSISERIEKQLLDSELKNKPSN
jgi:hypothetical protein